MNIGDEQKPLWIDMKNAMRISGIKRTTIYRLFSEGRLKTIKVGRRRLVSIKSIEQLGSDHEEDYSNSNPRKRANAGKSPHLVTGETMLAARQRIR